MKPTVLITGASIGIGYEFARIFAQHGYDLVLVARSGDRLKDLANRIFKETSALTTHLPHDQNFEQASATNPTLSVLIIEKDLSVAGAGKEVFDELKAKGIAVDVLVNNAGFGDYGLFHELTLARQVQMIDLNVRTLTELTHLFGGEMVKRGQGKILNVASTAAFQPGPLLAVYYATKHFVLAFSEALANEMKPFGVTVTALCPGPTESGFQEAANMGRSRLFRRFQLPSSYSVALYGFKAMNAGETVAVHGVLNRMMTKLVPFVPRGLITRIVRKVQE